MVAQFSRKHFLPLPLHGEYRTTAVCWCGGKVVCFFMPHAGLPSNMAIWSLITVIIGRWAQSRSFPNKNISEHHCLRVQKLILWVGKNLQNLLSSFNRTSYAKTLQQKFPFFYQPVCVDLVVSVSLSSCTWVWLLLLCVCVCVCMCVSACLNILGSIFK